MSDYYDSKGLHHSSEMDRDSANRSYLNEERAARDNQTEILQQQARLQAEQLRVAECRAREQRAHDERIEDLAREQARREESHRQFTRDIQWLERSDTKGKFAFLATKVQSGFVETLARDISASLGKSGLGEIFARAFNNFASANASLREAEAACLSAEGALAKADKTIKESNFGCVAFGCLPVAIIFAIWRVSAVLEKDGTDGGVKAGIICGIVVLVVVAFAFKQHADRKKAQAELAEIAPSIPKVRKDVEIAITLREKSRSEATNYFTPWTEECRATILEATQRRFADGDAAKLLLDQIAAEQEQYPPLCRVDFSAIDRTTIEATISTLHKEVSDKAIQLAAERSAVLVRLGSSAADAELLSELSEYKGPRLYSLVLVRLPDKSRLPIILLVNYKLKVGIGLEEAKRLVESAPVTLLENLESLDAQRAKQRLEDEGAEVELR